MDTTITHGNTTHYVHGRYSCDLANVVYLIRCRRECPEAWYIGETMQMLQQRMNGHRATLTSRYAPSQWDNTSVVKGIHLLIFGTSAIPRYCMETSIRDLFASFHWNGTCAHNLWPQ
eukprot:g36794.t1